MVRDELRLFRQLERDLACVQYPAGIQDALEEARKQLRDRGKFLDAVDHLYPRLPEEHASRGTCIQLINLLDPNPHWAAA